MSYSHDEPAVHQTYPIRLKGRIHRKAIGPVSVLKERRTTQLRVFTICNRDRDEGVVARDSMQIFGLVVGGMESSKNRVGLQYRLPIRSHVVLVGGPRPRQRGIGVANFYRFDSRSRDQLGQIGRL